MRGVLGQALGEPERDLALGRLDGVGAVDDVAADAVFFLKKNFEFFKVGFFFFLSVRNLSERVDVFFVPQPFPTKLAPLEPPLLSLSLLSLSLLSSTHSMQKSPRMVPGSEASGLVAPISLRPVATTDLPSQTIATTGALEIFGFDFVVFYHWIDGSVREEMERDGKRAPRESGGGSGSKGC